MVGNCTIIDARFVSVNDELELRIDLCVNNRSQWVFILSIIWTFHHSAKVGIRCGLHVTTGKLKNYNIHSTDI